MTIEVASRELEARTLLAFFSARSNFDVVLGRKKELINYALSAKPGIFLSQWGLHRNFLPIYKKLKKQGHLLVCFDEEGLVTNSFDNYAKTKINEDCIKLADKVLLWGLLQEQSFKAKFPLFSEKFKAVGNPRDDILDAKFKNLFDLGKINPVTIKSPGIVFVSSFGFVNHANGGEEYFVNSIKNGVFFNGEIVSIYRDYFNFQKKNFAKFLDLVEVTAKDYPEKTITYRCHPAENRESLLQRFKSMDNVQFSIGGSIIPVLRGAELVIHNYCHAGIEAQILGKKTFAMRYFKNPEIENEEVYKNSVSLDTVDEARKEISRFICSLREKNDDIIYKVSQDFLVSDEMKMAVERFIDTFVQVSANLNAQRSAKIFDVSDYIDRIKRSLRKQKNSYVDQKSQGLDFETVKKILDEILKLYPSERMILDFKQIKPYIFELKSQNCINNE